MLHSSEPTVEPVVATNINARYDFDSTGISYQMSLSVLVAPATEA